MNSYLFACDQIYSSMESSVEDLSKDFHPLCDQEISFYDWTTPTDDLSNCQRFDSNSLFGFKSSTQHHQTTKDPRTMACPSPQHFSYSFNEAYSGETHKDDDEFSDTFQLSDHHLEMALQEMMNKGELEDFLIENTISLREIQDDLNLHKMKTSLEKHTQQQRQRRHSIGCASELISCPYPGCERVFNRAYNFKSHFKIHTGDRPFKCAHCALCFARNHDLKRHVVCIHTSSVQSSAKYAAAVKAEIKCEKCEKIFSRSDALIRHLRLNACNTRTGLPRRNSRSPQQ